MKNFLTPKIENLGPHSSNSIENATPVMSSHENATISSGTCPLASYKEVPLGYFVQIKGVLTR